MVRTQIQLTEEESAALKDAARRSGLSVAELIRRSVDRFLAEAGREEPSVVGRLSALKVVGLFSSGLSDVSARFDDYLDEAYLPPRS
jgi:Ribbon-helix-helix protein, copG family